MDDAIHKAIADLSALIKDADSEDAERIRQIVERLQNVDARMLTLARASVSLYNPHHGVTARGSHSSGLPAREMGAGLVSLCVIAEDWRSPG
jgi:hypothetical protein